MDNLTTLLNYLDAEQIYLDKDEFEYQFNSHPDYPSLLALSDTLTFFNINNGAFKIDKTEIDLLPNKFVARLKHDKKDFLSFVEKKSNSISYTNGADKNYTIPKDEFESLWDNVVLLVEQDEVPAQKKSKNWLSKSMLIITVILFIIILIMTLPNIWFGAFYGFPIVGIIFSIAALKDLFNTQNELLNKFCNVNKTTSCDTVVNSSKWKIFDVINFSDLSILFFSTQLVSIFLIGLSGYYEIYFSIQIFLLLFAIPIVITSLYYQKYVEKKWCPVCLLIISVVMLELGYMFLLKGNLEFNFTVNQYGLVLFLASFTLSATIWFPLKNIFKRLNHLKTVELKSNRFKRNYKIFKKMLLDSTYHELPKSLLVFGNNTSSLNINIVTSPYCGHCEKPHYMLKSILDKYGERLSISILNNLNQKSSQLNTFLKSFITLGKDNHKAYYEAMDYWYDTKNDEKWLNKYQVAINNLEIEKNLTLQHLWLKEHGFNFTPCLFINGYQFPNEYDIADLPFFIEELIEDSFFGDKRINNTKIVQTLNWN